MKIQATYWCHSQSDICNPISSQSGGWDAETGDKSMAAGGCRRLRVIIQLQRQSCTCVTDQIVVSIHLRIITYHPAVRPANDVSTPITDTMCVSAIHLSFNVLHCERDGWDIVQQSCAFLRQCYVVRMYGIKVLQKKKISAFQHSATNICYVFVLFIFWCITRNNAKYKHNVF